MDEAKARAAITAASDALARHLEQHPDDHAALRLAPGSAAEVKTRLAEVVSGDELRLVYRRHLLTIAAHDLTGDGSEQGLRQTMIHLSDLADAVVEAALRLAVDQLGDPGARIGIVAMGKCGARELNYVSDVDIIAIAEPREGSDPTQAMARAGEVVALAMRICSAHTSAGTIWEVDAALRPEGKAGPLVRTLASMAAYYEEWADPWEFQALLKARPMAGDLDLARDFCALVAPRVWSVADRPEFVGDVQAMRRRVVSLLPPREADREIKLGAGGLRDVEFTVQLLQLIHGRADERLRVRGTLEALDALAAHGYVGRADAAAMASAYTWMRRLEHLIQLRRLRRTHLLPTDERSLAQLSSLMGVDDVGQAFRRKAVEVRRLHERVFYSPLLAAVARLRPDELSLTDEQAATRLAALGYADPTAALRHLQALTRGLSRKADIQRQLLPAMLGWFAESPLPDAGLLAFRRVSEALGESPWYLRALRDEGAMAQRLAFLLASSRYAVDLLLRDPECVRFLAEPDGLVPRTQEEIARTMAAVASRHSEPADAVAAVRAVRRRELFRLVAGLVVGEVDVDARGRGLSDLASATLDNVLTIARARHDAPPIGVLAMGRWGGRELSLASDIDVIFLVDDAAGIDAATAAVADARAWLGAAGPDPALHIDADLRPEGKAGPLVRTVESCLEHWRSRAEPWEIHALVRARHGAGDPRITGPALAAIGDLVFAEGGPAPDHVRQMRRLKARMESERMPRGQNPATHVKLGPGGLSDVEWTVQLHQMRRGAEIEGARTASTLPALAALVEAGVVAGADAEDLRAAWTFASTLRDVMLAVRGRASDSLPSDARELAAVAHLMGLGRSAGSLLDQQWRRLGRRARQVTERLFIADGT